MITLYSQHWQMNGFSFLIQDLSLSWRALCPACSQSSSLQLLQVIYMDAKPTKVNNMNFRDLQPFNSLFTEKPKLQCLLHTDYPSGDLKIKNKKQVLIFLLP